MKADAEIRAPFESYICLTHQNASKVTIRMTFGHSETLIPRELGQMSNCEQSSKMPDGKCSGETIL